MSRHDEWYEDGRWVGPADFRLFWRENLLFASLLYAVVTAIAIAICTDLTDSGWFGVPLGTAAGSLAWFGVMFAFSRGWIAEGD